MDMEMNIDMGMFELEQPKEDMLATGILAEMARLGVTTPEAMAALNNVSASLLASQESEGCDVRYLTEGFCGILELTVAEMTEGHVSVEDAVRAIVERHRGRIQRYVDEKRMAVGLLRSMGLTYKRIGEIIGRKYSTAIHHDRIHQWLLAHDKKYNAAYEQFKKRLQ